MMRRHCLSALRRMSKPATLLLRSRLAAPSAHLLHRSSAAPGVRRWYSPDIKVPDLPDSITQGEIQQWHKEVGDAVEVDEILVTLETDKTEVEITSSVSGELTRVDAGEGDVVDEGSTIGFVEEGAGGAKAAPKEEKKVEEAPKEEKKAEEEAPKEEKKAKKSAPAPPAPKKAAKPAAAAANKQDSTSGGERSERRVRLNRMRKTVASRLKDAQNTAALLTTFQECDMTNIMALRTKYKDLFQKEHGVKLGFMSAFVKASAYALSRSPEVNAVIDGDEIVYRDYVDISVAVATPKGLVVPVVRDADKLSFAGVESTIVDLGTRARDGQLAMEEMVGGTFTISNGGVYGSMMGTPILNPPQSAILGMHNIEKRAVVVDDEIVIRPMMYLALTYDHRLIDGREAVTFLRTIKLAVEDPARMLLDL